MKLANTRVLGIGLVAVGSVFWSTAGLFVRFIDLDLWTMLAWRSLFAGLSLLAIVLLRNGRQSLAQARRCGWIYLAAAPISAVSMICYVSALRLTTVGNVMMVYATLPFVAAGIAFLWTGERAKPRVLWASAVALTGVLVITGFSTRLQDLTGIGLAFLMTATFGVLLVLARRRPDVDMAPVNTLASFLCAAACVPFAAGGVPPAGELIVVALFGAVTSGLAYLLFLTGGRYIPSSEAGLVGFIDVILGPFWVWLVFSERPSQALVYGGGLVLASVVWYLVRELRESDPIEA